MHVQHLGLNEVREGGFGISEPNWKALCSMNSECK